MVMYICTMEYYSALRKDKTKTGVSLKTTGCGQKTNKARPFAAVYLEPQSFMLSEVRGGTDTCSLLCGI